MFSNIFGPQKTHPLQTFKVKESFMSRREYWNFLQSREFTAVFELLEESDGDGRIVISIPFSRIKFAEAAVKLMKEYEKSHLEG